MKIAILTTLYRDALRLFYQHHTDIAQTSYQEHKRLLDIEISLWASAWQRALTKQGYEVLAIPVTADPLLSAWAKEQGIVARSSQDVVKEMLKKFQPEIVWYDSVDPALLRIVKDEIQSIRFTMGWSGSAIVGYDVFREVDIVLSCAPETVSKLKSDGFCTYQLHHAFDPLWVEQLLSSEKKYALTFIGQFIRGKAFHTEREQLLRTISHEIDLTIISPTYSMGMKDVFMTVLTQIAYLACVPIKHIGVPSFLSRSEKIRKVLALTQMPQFPYDQELKRLMKPPVFGKEMLQELIKSKIVLNIHADSSPLYASNMRLFETTGVGTLLLTEQRKNLSELFQPETEVVTYENSDECLEKTRWLFQHPGECRQIGLEGQKRTLKDHTFDQRAQQLQEILTKHIHR